MSHLELCLYTGEVKLRVYRANDCEYGATRCHTVWGRTAGYLWYLTFICLGRNDTEAEVGSVGSFLSGL